jgi:hypothetical protein
MNIDIDPRKPKETQGYSVKSARPPLFPDLTPGGISLPLRGIRMKVQEQPLRIVC